MKRTAQAVIPMAMILGAEAIQVETGAKTEVVSTSEAVSASQLNSQIQSTVGEAL
jgi:hypothetical protein